MLEDSLGMAWDFIGHVAFWYEAGVGGTFVFAQFED